MRQHFRAFLWLRWRLRVNQHEAGRDRQRGRPDASWPSSPLFVAVGLFVGFFFIGLFALPRRRPPVLLYVWDGLVVAFLFTWAIGLLTELQRSEVLSLDKFLHLPVSLTGAFLINYLSSLFELEHDRVRAGHGRR